MIERLGFDGSTPRATDGVLFGLGAQDDETDQRTGDDGARGPGSAADGAGPRDVDTHREGQPGVDGPTTQRRQPVATTLRSGDLQSAEPLWADAEPDAKVLRGGVEAVLMVADEPLDAATFARALGCGTAAVEDTLADLRIEYDADERGFELRQIAGGWRLYTRAEHADAVERFVLDGQQAKVSQAALETLAVVAYRQPVSRSRISAIRGVNVDGVIRTLVSRGLVDEAGTDPEGTAMLYRTTPYFLERLGVAGLHELPEVSDFLPEIGSVEDAEI